MSPTFNNVLRRLIKTTSVTVSVILLGVASFVGLYDLHDFRPYTKRMKAVFQTMEPEDRQPASNVQSFIWKVDGNIVDNFAAGRLLWEMRGAMRMSSWHYHSVMWVLMLRLHFDKRKRLAFYCHYLPYEHGSGFSNAARAYFDKQPHELTDEQLATLVAIGRSPSANSLTRHPDNLDRAKTRLLSASKDQ